MADRDEILVNFQAMTGVEDLVMCMEILEQKGWDLTAAVNSMLPSQPDYSQPPSLPPTTAAEASRALGFIDLTTHTPTQVSLPERSQPYVDLSTDSAVVGEVIPSGPLAELDVFYGTRVIKLHMPYSSTVAQVKEQLELNTGIQSYRQILKGWPSSPPHSDQESLVSLGLFRGSHVLTLEHTPPTTSIHGPPPSYSEVAALSSSLEETIAGASSYSIPVLVGDHVATRAVPNPPTINVDVQEETRRESPVLVSSLSSSSHYSDAPDTISSEDDEAVMESFDDGIFEDPADNAPHSKAMKEPLIPPGCLEPYEALQFFTHAFEARYGSMHPLFLIGSLSEAMREATSGSALSGTRKPMFIYLHHDGSILSNIFCSQLLCSESVVNYLTSNFVSWAWDLTHHQSRIKLLQMVEECFGKMAKISVDEIQADHLPAILIVYKVKGSTDIKNIIQGETNLDSLMTSLMSAMDDHNLNIEMERMEERERIHREQMIAEQNRAYEESLIADKEKARQREEEEKARVEKEEEEERERNNREEQREAMEVRVPDEPPVDSEEKVCTLRIRYPDGSQITRRFLAAHQLQDLLNLLGSQGYLMSDFKILTSFPRRDISEGNHLDSLEQCRLCPQETLFVEER